MHHLRLNSCGLKKYYRIFKICGYGEDDTNILPFTNMIKNLIGNLNTKFVLEVCYKSFIRQCFFKYKL